MPNNKNYKTLDLADKVKVIRLYEKTGKGSRALAAEFNVGKTQIQGILKRKREHLDDYEKNAPRTKKRCNRITGNEEINKLCYRWFIDCLSRVTPVSGPMLQEKALQFAAELGITSFKKRHNIAGASMIGECCCRSCCCGRLDN